MRKAILLACAILTQWSSLAQTNPAPFNLTPTVSYALNSWDSTQAAQTYPPNMMFHMASLLDPGLDTPMTSNYTAAYNLTTQTRVSGRGADGFSFINTSTARDGGYLGAAVLSFNTTSLVAPNVGLRLSFKARTWIRNFRPYALRLQYRTDTLSTWLDVTNLASQPIEYVADSLNAWQNFVVGLPNALLNKPFAQVRWKYYFIPGTGATGARPMIGLDDILLETITPASVPQLKANGLQIWPNPGNGTLQFNKEVKQVEVINIQGQSLGIFALPSGSSELTLTGLRNGMYILKVQTEEGSTLVRYSKID